MANSALLIEKYESSGKKKSHLAERLMVSRPRLETIFHDPESATVVQADTLCAELKISAQEKREIFLP